jgi:uncharacterized RDD family membrane protein YckC
VRFVTREPPPASPGYRLGGAIVDSSLALLAAAVAGAVVGAGGGTSRAGSWAGVLAAVAFTVLNLVVIAGRSDGQSLGKKLAATQVARDDGRAYGFQTALLRDVVARVVLVVPFLGLVDEALVLRADRRSLRDRFAHTRVVRMPAYRARRGPLTAVATALAAVWVALVMAGMAASHPAADGYSSLERASFVSGCTRGGQVGADVCGCTFDSVRARVPHALFAEAEQVDASRWSPQVREALTTAMQGCLAASDAAAPPGAGSS